MLATAIAAGTGGEAAQAESSAYAWARYVPEFNRNDDELYTNAIPNSAAEAFLRENAPLFTCPDKDIERTYHFRWWTYRKHIKKSSDGGWVVTEFLPSVPWAGPHEWEWFSLRNLHHCGHVVDIDYARTNGLSVTVNGQPYHRH